MKYSVELDMSAATSHTLILSRIRPNSRVLEFGTASGYMTKYMREVLNCEVYGVELDQEAAKYAEPYTKIMIVGDIEEQKWYEILKDEQFDYILFADVLEHLRNPELILKLVVNLLKDEGNIITSVPNISHNAIIMELMQGKFEYKPIGLLDETHIKFFTRTNVLKMLEYAGLAPIEWLVTQRKPETTEFKQDYRYFPIEVRKYLQSRPDGDVYQFVTVSGKKEFVNNDNLFESEYINYLDSDFIQIFWGSKSVFSEEHSVRKVHQVTEEIVSYNLKLPIGALGEVRIDLSSELSCGEIHDIQIYSEDKSNVVYSWDKKATSLSFYNLSLIQHNNFVEFITTSNDPQFVINNFSLSESDNHWYIEIKVKIKKDLSRIINYLVHSLASYVNQTQMNDIELQRERELNEQLKQKINMLEQRISDYDKTVSQYENIYNNIHNINTAMEKICEVIKHQHIENKDDLKEVFEGLSRMVQNINDISQNIFNDQSKIQKHISSVVENNQIQLLEIKQLLNKPNLVKRIYRKLVKR